MDNVKSLAHEHREQTLIHQLCAVCLQAGYHTSLRFCFLVCAMRPLSPGPMGFQEFIWGQRLVQMDAMTEAACGHTAIVTVTSEPWHTLWAPHSPLRNRTALPLRHLRKFPVASQGIIQWHRRRTGSGPQRHLEGNV